MAVRFPGPSTALKGMILFTGTRPQLSATAMPVSFCSMSLPHFSLEDAAVVFGSHAEGRGVLKDVFAPLQFLDLRFFHQITGDTDHITVCRIEGQVADSLAERAFDDIQKEVVVLVYRGIDGENVSGS